MFYKRNLILVWKIREIRILLEIPQKILGLWLNHSRSCRKAEFTISMLLWACWPRNLKYDECMNYTATSWTYTNFNHVHRNSWPWCHSCAEFNRSCIRNVSKPYTAKDKYSVGYFTLPGFLSNPWSGCTRLPPQTIPLGMSWPESNRCSQKLPPQTDVLS